MIALVALLATRPLSYGASSVLKPASRLWAATPADLYGVRDAGDAIALEDDLELVACKLTRAPDGWTVPVVYGSELCAASDLARCRAGLGCAANHNVQGRCATDDIARLPRSSMAMYVKLSGTRDQPECEFVKVVDDGATSTGTAPQDTAVVYDVEGMVFWSLGLVSKLRTTTASEYVFHWMFTHAGKAMLGELLGEKCGDGGIACRAQARRVLAQGYHGLDQGEFSEQRWFNQNVPDTTCSHNSGPADVAGHTGGMHWVFGVPLYVVDVGEMEEDNAVLTAIIKDQFEQLDAGGWGKDRTYPGAAKAASEMQPADRNDEFVSLKPAGEMHNCSWCSESISVAVLHWTCVQFNWQQAGDIAWQNHRWQCSQRSPEPPPAVCEAEALAVHWPEMRNTTAFQR